MSLSILKAGILDTIQDQGRFGFRQFGINPGGAMDQYALQVANALVGNPFEETVIEIHFPAPELEFLADAVIAIAGADFTPFINNRKTDILHPVAVRQGARLRFEKSVMGTCCYLAVRSGFDLQPWLGSHSTHIKAGAGGFKGRPLKKDDSIPLKKNINLSEFAGDNDFLQFHWKAAPQSMDHLPENISVMRGPEWDWLTQDAKKNFIHDEFIISSQSDRMGYRLHGNDLSSGVEEELISSAVSFGSIQLLPNGQLTILMADHQTMGGYPRIAQVIAAHHSRLAQKKPKEKIHFQLTDNKSAEIIYLKQQEDLRLLQIACSLKLDEILYP
ncbi:MAG: 5-oxoprolinase/urea amidolyase family protein [Terrimonas sp.]|nr:5-oxoprolinase/urea amidolyase family protein [Terrimonas sp.]